MKSAKDTLRDAATLVAAGWTAGTVCRDERRQACDAQHATYYTLGGALWVASGKDPRAYVAALDAMTSDGMACARNDFEDGDHCARVLRYVAEEL